ncbi:MAG: hypothetical protein AAF849_19765 [Bacteroidota bacterium]
MLFLSRLLLFGLLLFLFTACDDDLSPAAAAVINDNATASTEELLLELEIQQGERYIVLDSVKNIEVFINGQPWATFDYALPNQSRFDDLQEENNFLTTDIAFSHKLVLNYLTTAEDFQTAGQFADFIRNFLQPGEYFCSILSLSIFNQEDEAQEIILFEDFLLEVGNQEKSIYVGKIQIQL